MSGIQQMLLAGAAAVESTLTYIPLYGQSLSLGSTPTGPDEVLSVDTPVNITGATQDNPVVITAVGHNLSEGDTVFIKDVGGMTQLNNRTFEVVSVTSDTAALHTHDGAVPSVTTLNGTGYSAYSTGGTLAKATKSTNHFMFNGGVRFHYDDTDTSSNLNFPVSSDSLLSLIPLQARINPWRTGFGETLAEGMGARISTPSIFATSGRGGYKAVELERGTVAGFIHFSNTYEGVMRAKDLATALGETFVLGPVVFKHGESDGTAGTSRSSYKTTLETMLSDFEICFSYAAAQDVSPVQMLGDQICVGSLAFMNVAVASIELHRENANFYCAGPTYWIPTDNFEAPNDVHLKPIGYRALGEKYGLIVKEMLSTGTWNPCHITTAPTRVGTTITVPIHVPVAPLVEDTTLVLSAANKGFSYSGANILSVTIVDTGTGDNTASIEIVIDASSGGTLRYAYDNWVTPNYVGASFGSRGNIRDSSTDVAEIDGRKLYNWLCADEWIIT